MSAATPALWTPERRITLVPGDWRPTEGFLERLRARPEGFGILSLLPPGVRAELEIVFMAGSKTNFAENKVKNALYNAASIGIPTDYYFGLWTAALTDASTGSAASETAYGSYARVQKALNTTNFATVGDNTSIKNSTAITFPQATSGPSTVTHVGVTTATSAGDMWAWADLTVSRTIDSGEIPEFAVNAYTHDED